MKGRAKGIAQQADFSSALKKRSAGSQARRWRAAKQRRDRAPWRKDKLVEGSRQAGVHPLIYEITERDYFNALLCRGAASRRSAMPIRKSACQG